MPYTAQRTATSRFEPLREITYHLLSWGGASLASASRPPLVMLHGWMDVAASFQFVVDALARAEGFERWIIAPDWRGYGLTRPTGIDCYWFPDYLGDLDALLDRVVGPDQPIDLLGHSMGGNVAMIYAGLRSQRIRRLVSLEGFGMPQTQADEAPARLVQWLEELKKPAVLRSYDSEAAVAERLLKNNPLLSRDKAEWLAPHWSAPGADGRWQIRGDPAHRRVNPVLSRREEALACWRRIGAPVLWVEGDRTDMSQWWGERYLRSDFEQRLAVIARLERATLSPSGHMLHHDQPDALAAHLARFLS